MTGQPSASSSRSSVHSTSSSSCTPDSPLAMSSPKASTNRTFRHNLRLLEINFRSVWAKRFEFWSLVDATKPDVIFGCETWLKPTKLNGEFMPDDFDTYRKDRGDGYGGVFLAIHRSLNSHQLDIDSTTDLVAAKIVNGITRTSSLLLYIVLQIMTSSIWKIYAAPSLNYVMNILKLPSGFLATSTFQTSCGTLTVSANLHNITQPSMNIA